MTHNKNSHAQTFTLAAYIFMILLYLFSSPPFICISTIICSVMHEACHILCARILGRRVRILSFGPTGLYPDLDCGTEISRILIYAAGPCFNIIVCAVCLWYLHGGYNEHLFELFCVNCALAVYNLTPIPFSDGDGIMRASLGFFLGEKVGGWLCCMLELIFSFLFFVIFSYRFFSVGTGFFSFFCSFIFVMSSISSFQRE